MGDPKVPVRKYKKGKTKKLFIASKATSPHGTRPLMGKSKQAYVPRHGKKAKRKVWRANTNLRRNQGTEEKTVNMKHYAEMNQKRRSKNIPGAVHKEEADHLGG